MESLCHTHKHTRALILIHLNGRMSDDSTLGGHRKKNGKNLCFCCKCIPIDSIKIVMFRRQEDYYYIFCNVYIILCIGESFQEEGRSELE